MDKLVKSTPQNKILNPDVLGTIIVVFFDKKAQLHYVSSSVPGKQMCPFQVEAARMSESSEMGVMGYKGGRE